jgi:hypothetical protein
LNVTFKNRGANRIYQIAIGAALTICLLLRDEAERIVLNMKPAMGFTLPSGGGDPCTRVDDGAGDAGRSVAKIDGENSIFSRRGPARRETGISPHYCELCGTKSAETLPRKVVRSMERVDVRKSKRKFLLNPPRDKCRC